jgi:purine catabolism regulator
MPATVRRLLRQTALDLTLLTAGRSLEEPILWIHGSDLVDPTPFLSEGQMLLTTGTQFPDAALLSDFDAYVARLVARGVVALGFGTEVVRSGTPQELIAACVSQGLPLIEVPYPTPFIAIIRWAADVISHEARARDDWSLGAQRAISLAALSQGGLTGVLVALAEQLGARVAVFGAAGELDPLISPSAFRADERVALAVEARRLLARGGRSAGTISLGGERASLQTLGRRDELRGVLAVVGGTDFDAAVQTVLTSAVALAEVALEQSVSRRGSRMPLNGELLSLLLASSSESVRRTVPEPPTGTVIVALCRVRGGPEDAGDAIERAVADAFVAPLLGDVVVVATEKHWPGMAGIVSAHAIGTGVSDAIGPQQLGAGIAQARRALGAAGQRAGSLVEFRAVRDSDFLGLLSQPQLGDASTARLSTLLADDSGRELLHCASVWLSHNGAWDPAARELGMHRHSLKARMDQLGRVLGLSLDTFADRAQLWAMLYSRDLDGGGAR